MEMGYRRWFIVGCYLAPDDASSMKRDVRTMEQRPHEAALMVVGDLNGNILKPGGIVKYKAIKEYLSDAGLEDMYSHFLPHHTPWERDRRTWSIIRRGRVVLSQTEDIIGTDRHLLQNVFIWEPIHNIEYYMVLGCIRSITRSDHQR